MQSKLDYIHNLNGNKTWTCYLSQSIFFFCYSETEKALLSKICYKIIKSSYHDILLLKVTMSNDLVFDCSLLFQQQFQGGFEIKSVLITKEDTA